MSEPVYGIAVERLYSRLPEAVRVADAAQDWALKKYLSAVGESLSDVDLLSARFSYLPADVRARLTPEYVYVRDDVTPVTYSTCDLLDGAKADEAWLPWIAQLIGLDIGTLSVQERRDAVTYASSGFRAGSRQAIIDAVKGELAGSKFVEIYPNSNAINPIGTATMWEVLIVTRTSETPEFAQIVDAVNHKGAKPAGVLLSHRSYEVPWNEQELAFATWNAIDAATWNALEEAGLS